MWPLLDGLPEAEARQVLSMARRRRFSRGEVVFHEGDPADTLHLIGKGRFSVRVNTPLGDTAALTVLGPGDVFGELALLGGEPQPRSATVMALEAAETSSIHRIDFERLRREHPGGTDFLVSVLAAQVRRLSGHLLEALYVPADARVRRRLLDLARLYGGEDLAGAVIPLTQEDLAESAGTSRATVNRVLREEEEAGTLELSRGRTKLVDPEPIAARAR